MGHARIDTECMKPLFKGLFITLWLVSVAQGSVFKGVFSPSLPWQD